MPRTFLVTAALPYSNGRLHVGHIAGAYLPADIYVRYLRARGEDVRFICGSDDNGVAITITADELGITPAEVCAKFHASQQASFAGLGISFDVYGGTHHPDFVATHERFSQAMFRAVHAKGLFAKRRGPQLYDAQRGRFLPDRYVTGTCPHCGYAKANGDQCENCGKSLDALELKNPRSVLTGAVPEVRDTTHWHLRLDAFAGRLKEWLESKTEWRPFVRNGALGQAKDLRERSMTRDLEWGVPVPLDDPEAAGKVLYVWFDAPVGYVSFTQRLLESEGQGPDAWKRYWQNPDAKVIHFIGEDNIVFHALIWPAMLLAEGSFPLPEAVVANSFLNIKFPGQEEEKISKSRGTAVWIEDYLTQFDPDPLRYYLTAIAPEGARTPYQPEEFVARNDGELVATLGNFINRTVAFAHRYFEGRVPAAGERADIDLAALAAIPAHAARIADHLEGHRFKAALAEVMALARAGNLYMDQKKPWNERKASLEACGVSINVCLQLIAGLATVMQPFLPFSARRTAAMLGADEGLFAWSAIGTEIEDGRPLGEAAVLFRKLAEPAKT